MAHTKMRSQPRLPKGISRWPVSSAFTPKLERAIKAEQDRWTSSRYGRPSRSFIIANATAWALNVDLEYSYRSTPDTRSKRGKR